MLPVGYHLDHFREMLAFVTQLYGPILGPGTQSWLQDFQSLPAAAQSLFVRFANRKGTIFRTGKLCYEDVPKIGAAIADLAHFGFVSPVNPTDFDALLALLTKAELAAILTAAGVAVHKSQSRGDLVEAARGSLDFERLFLKAITGDLVVRRRLKPLRYLLFLYFGRIEDTLTRFTLRDLGQMQTHAGQQDFAPRFTCRHAAEQSFHYASCRADLPGLSEAALLSLARELPDWPEPVAAAADYRDALIFDLGRCLERAAHKDVAQSVYALGRSFECIERWVRLAWTAGERQAVETCLEAMRAEPRSEAEAIFASDFLDRKIAGKRTGIFTDVLRTADAVPIDANLFMSPESAVLSSYAADGWQGYHAENEPWRALFGLLFWDWLYGRHAPPLQNEFQRIPASLRDRSFYDANARELERRLTVLSKPEKTVHLLEAVFAAEQGAPNAMLGWGEAVLDRLDPLVRLAPRGAIAVVMRALAHDYRARKTGFPDLILWRGSQLRLVEVKTATDSLRRNQLAQLRLLGKAGFDVRVERAIQRDQIA